LQTHKPPPLLNFEAFCSTQKAAGALSAKKSHCIIAAANQPRGHRTQQPSMHTQQQALINAPRENILQAKPPFELTGEHF
jgi:hypothetical protein